MAISTILQSGALALALLPALATACDPQCAPLGDRTGAAPSHGAIAAAPPAHAGPGVAAEVRLPARGNGAPGLGTPHSAAGLDRARGGSGSGMTGTATLGGMVSGNSATGNGTQPLVGVTIGGVPMSPGQLLPRGTRVDLIFPTDPPAAPTAP